MTLFSDGPKTTQERPLGAPRPSGERGWGEGRKRDQWLSVIFATFLRLARSWYALALFSLLGGALLLMIALWALYVPRVSGEEIEDQVWSADQLTVAVGKAVPLGQGIKLSLDSKGLGAVKLPAHGLSARDHPFLNLRTAGDAQDVSLSLVWQRDQAPKLWSRYALPRADRPSIWISILPVPDWRGTLGNLFITVKGEPGATLVLSGVTLAAPSLRTLLAATYAQWVSFQEWQQPSINAYSGVAVRAPLLFPVPTIAALLALSLLVYTIVRLTLRPKLHFDWRVAAALAIVCWLALDLPWQGKALERSFGRPTTRFAGSTADQKHLAAPDRDMFAFMERVEACRLRPRGAGIPRDGRRLRWGARGISPVPTQRLLAQGRAGAAGPELHLLGRLHRGLLIPAGALRSEQRDISLARRQREGEDDLSRKRRRPVQGNVMELVRLCFALALPWLLGAVWMNLVIPGPAAGRRAIVLGYGYLFGSVVFTLLMRGVDGLGMPLNFVGLTAAGLLVTVPGLLLNFRTGRQRFNGVWLSPELRELPSWQQVLLGCLFAVVAIRLVGLGLEIIWRPLFPWDASIHWAREAKVWFAASKILPFVDYDTWLKSGNPHVYTDVHPDYPITVPLLQVWVNKALGHWDDSLMNLPWVLCAAALGLAFFGQARLAGVRPLAAMIFTYILLSMPLLDTHVALAGYADLFLGACYGAATMAFFQWSVRKDRGQAVLAIAMAVCCTLIKNEGLFWALTFVPAWLVVVLPWRRAAILLLLGLLLVGVALWLMPPDLRVAGHSLRELNLHFRDAALRPIGQSFWLLDSWHLLAYFLAAVLPLGVLLLGSRRWLYLGVGTALGTAAVLFLILFAFTGYAGGAIRFTAVSRITLHLVPAYTFLLMLVYSDLPSRRTGSCARPCADGRLAAEGFRRRLLLDALNAAASGER